jgi:uncharacterized protein (DUF4415 family)
MKSATTRKPLPADSAAWDALIASAPGKDRAPSAAEQVQRRHAVVTEGGGYPAVKAALQAARGRGQRGPQHSPTKQLVSVRYSPDVLAYFKATGAGWQTRMNEALQEWVASHPASTDKHRKA